MEDKREAVLEYFMRGESLTEAKLLHDVAGDVLRARHCGIAGHRLYLALENERGQRRVVCERCGWTSGTTFGESGTMAQAEELKLQARAAGAVRSRQKGRRRR